MGPMGLVHLPSSCSSQCLHVGAAGHSSLHFLKPLTYPQAEVHMAGHQCSRQLDQLLQAARPLPCLNTTYIPAEKIRAESCSQGLPTTTERVRAESCSLGLPTTGSVQSSQQCFPSPWPLCYPGPRE